MKVMDIMACISGGIGILIVVIAGISVIIGRNIFGFTHLVNYFHAANSFLLISIVLFLAGKRIDAGK